MRIKTRREGEGVRGAAKEGGERCCRPQFRNTGWQSERRKNGRTGGCTNYAEASHCTWKEQLSNNNVQIFLADLIITVQFKMLLILDQ